MSKPRRTFLTRATVRGNKTKRLQGQSTKPNKAEPRKRVFQGLSRVLGEGFVIPKGSVFVPGKGFIDIQELSSKSSSSSLQEQIDNLSAAYKNLLNQHIILLDQYNNLRDRIEDIEDIMVYDVAKLESDGELLSFDDAIMEIERIANSHEHHDK